MVHLVVLAIVVVALRALRERARTRPFLVVKRRSECVLSVPEHYDCVLTYQHGASCTAKTTSPMHKAVATHYER
jgi:hypothetical protein